ncbi:MAG: EAL and HDOD domain-containing protein [Lysobacterales bacterium]
MSEIFIARQPIFDTSVQVVANELLFRPLDADDAFEADRATARVMMSALVELDFDAVSGNKPVYINMTRPFLTGEQVLPLDRERIVLEVLETTVVDKPVLKGVSRLAAEGFHIALDDFHMDLSTAQLLPYAKTVKLDVLDLNEQQLADHVRKLKDLGKIVLAEKVETQNHFEVCKKLGFHLYQGYFLSRPELVSGRSIPDGLASSLQLLNKLNDPTVEVDEIERLIQLDVGLSYRLLRYINSSFFGFASTISSIRQALVMMGMVDIRRWASLLTLAKMRSEPTELLRLALQRARMCELLAEAAGQDDRARFFTVGLFSRLDSMLNVPMAEIVATLPLNDEFLKALIDGDGICGQALACCRDYECERINDAGFSILSFDAIRGAYIEALRWSDDIVGELAGSSTQAPQSQAMSA